MGELLFSYFRVTNVELINEKKSLRYYSLNVCKPLEIDATQHACLGVAQACSKVGVTGMWFRKFSNVTFSYLQ